MAVTLVRPGQASALASLEAALRAVAVGGSRAPDIARLVPTARSLLR